MFVLMVQDDYEYATGPIGIFDHEPSEQEIDHAFKVHSEEQSKLMEEDPDLEDSYSLTKEDCVRYWVTEVPVF